MHRTGERTSFDLDVKAEQLEYKKFSYMVGLFVFDVTQIKTGAPCRSERLAKYNQILRLVFTFARLTGKNVPTFLATAVNY